MIASVHIADIGRKALGALARGAPKPSSVAGLRSARLGFAAPLTTSTLPSPQVGRLGFVAMWDDDDALDRFLADHPLAAKLAGGWHVRLEPLRAHGSWPGLPSDVPKQRNVDHEGPAAVLTLGRARLTQLIRFLRTSAKAEAATVGAPGLVWTTGMARPPFFATCSLWETSEALSAYAYGQGDLPHPAAIAVDRAKPFHHESAFIRFRPYRSEGQLAGKNPLSAAWLSSVSGSQR